MFTRRFAVFFCVLAAAGSAQAGGPAKATLKTTLGLARRAHTQHGDVLVVAAPGPRPDSPREVFTVTELNGKHVFARIPAITTPYGQTSVQLGNGVVRHVVTVDDAKYRVFQDHAGKLSYVDAAGHRHQEIISAGEDLVTPQGVAKLVTTPAGKQHVLALARANVTPGSAMPKQLSIVEQKGNALTYTPIAALNTPFGQTQMVLRDGRLVHTLRIADRPFEVRQSSTGSFVYVDPQGTSHEGIVRLGKHFLTPGGITRTVRTRNGEQEVLVGMQRDVMTVQLVEPKDGGLVTTAYPNVLTIYGRADVKIENGRLDRVVTVEGKHYSVEGSTAPVFTYIDANGRSSTGAITIGKNIVTPQGRTKTLIMPEGEQEILVTEQSLFNRPATKTYQRVQLHTNGMPVMQPLPPISTVYGQAPLVERDGHAAYRIEIEGKSYAVSRSPANVVEFTDEHGARSHGLIVKDGHFRVGNAWTQTLHTSLGPQEFLVPGGAPGVGALQAITVNAHGQTVQTPIAAIATAYGNALPRVENGAIVHNVMVQGHNYRVEADAQHGVRFVDGAGQVHLGAIREGQHYVTPLGTTRTMSIDGVEREVVNHRNVIQVVNLLNGITYLPVGPHNTGYGAAQAVIEGEKVVHRLTIDNVVYDVKQGANDFVYTDPHGNSHGGAIAVGGHLRLPHGMTQTMEVGGAPAEVLVGARAPMYQLARVVDGKLWVDDLATLKTPLGNAILRVDNGKLVHEVTAGGVRYRAVLHDDRFELVDGLGRAYVDTFLDMVKSKTAAPVTARRVLSHEPLPALPDGPIVTIGVAHQATQHVSKAMYDELRDAMIEAMSMYDPKTHYFIGLGSDPHPILAFLENIGGKGLATNFPASGKNYNGLDPMVLDAYVRKLIPPEVLNGSKTLVFIDQTTSGATREGTLAQVSRVFEKYLHQIGSPAKVTRLAFSPNVHPDGTGVVNTAKYPEVGRFLGAPYEHVVSEYDRHVLGSNTIEQLVPRPQYQQFKDAMLERMKRDEKLDGFLREKLGE